MRPLVYVAREITRKTNQTVVLVENGTAIASVA